MGGEGAEVQGLQWGVPEAAGAYHCGPEGVFLVFKPDQHSYFKRAWF